MESPFKARLITPGEISMGARYQPGRMGKGECMDFSGGLRANRESSSNVTPGSALEPALPPRISLVRDGAGRELGFHPKGHSLCFARVFPRHRPLILPGVSNPSAGGGRKQQRTESSLAAGAGRSSAAPPAHLGLRSPRSVCRGSRAGLATVRGALRLSSCLRPNPHSRRGRSPPDPTRHF